MWKKPAGNLVGWAVAVERAVVGEHVRPATPRILPSGGGGDLAVHVVVAGERRAHQVLGPVLDPLDRLAGDDGTHDRDST